MSKMTENPDTTAGAATEPTGAPAAPLRKRKLADREIVKRRAEGELLAPLAQAAGIGVPTLSEWLRRPNIAAKLADAKLDLQLTKELADRERRERERKAKAAKRQAAKLAKPPEPEPEFNAAVETYSAYVDRQARAGKEGRLLKAIGIRW